MPLSDSEKRLRSEVIRLESEIEDLRRKLQIAETVNFKLYRQTQDLSYYIRNMEGYSKDVLDK